MKTANVKQVIHNALDQGVGILRLAPNWVPREFCIPGRRIKLHPDDYYALGAHRGGIDERWFASTTTADNGPNTSPNEGLSFLVFEDGPETHRVLFRDAVDELKGQLIGEKLWQDYGCWPMYSKFFDNLGPLPFHIHHREHHAQLTGQRGKPEAYFFPPQLNNHGGMFPYTFLGLNPGTTKEQIRQCLVNFEKGDNRITDFSAAYRLVPGTGWDVPAGMLHAPGSLCTYEPQKASDVFAMYQSLAGGKIIPHELLWKNTPPDKINDIDHLLDVIDWELNLDPDIARNRFLPPVPVMPLDQMRDTGYAENWIAYKSPDFSAKELTVMPGRTVTITDPGAYGLIIMQGHGRMGPWDIETPALIHFGQLTHDEYFVSEAAAHAGVKITNPSTTDSIVMLKHFGPHTAPNVTELGKDILRE